MDNGISIAYRGTDIRFASDYSKSIDSRWKFMEVAFENYNKTLTLPAIAPGVFGTVGFEQSYVIVEHNLGFYPFFECQVSIIEGRPNDSQSGQTSASGFVIYPFRIYSDKNKLYVFPSYQGDYGQSPVKLLIQYRVYNINIDEEYEAPPFGQPAANAGKSSYGVKMLDGTQPIDLSSQAVEGFSIDTTQKTLSIHSIHTQYVDNTNDRIKHTVGYPPTYFLCEKANQPFKDYGAGFNIPHRNWTLSAGRIEPFARFSATGSEIRIRGVQSVFMGTYCFVILKDPAEIAK